MAPSASAADDNPEALNDDSYHDELKARFKFFKPAVVLALFTMINFFTYYDRGVMSTVLVDVKSDRTIISNNETLSNSELGALSSAFMAGYFATSPLFAALGTKLNPKIIILIGIYGWMCACLASGFSKGYYMLLVARGFVGMGEAAYVGYMITIVDNMAPARLRTMWIGIFYSMIPVGQAAGLAIGGVIADKANLSPTIGGWRVAFVTETVPMLLLSFLMMALPANYNAKPLAARTVQASDDNPQVVGGGAKNGAGSGHQIQDPNAVSPGSSGRQLHDGTTIGDSKTAAETEAENAAIAEAEAQNRPPSLFRAVALLVCNGNWMCLAFGYGVYTFVLGGIVGWAITALTTGPLQFSKVDASIIFGAVTVVTGLGGSLAGGIILDRMGGSKGPKGMMRCSAFNVAMVLISIPCGVIALMTSLHAVFIPFFSVAVFVLFTITAPVNASILSSVPKNMRTYAINFSVLVMHGMGDFPSPIIAGKISDSFSQGCTDIDQISCVGINGTGVNATGVNCRWIPPSGDDLPYCVNFYQWRNALSILYALLIFAAPLWGAVAFRAKCDLNKETEMDTLGARLNPE